MESKPIIQNNMHWGYGILIGVGVLAGIYGLWCGISYYSRASVEKLNYHVLAKLQGHQSRQQVEIRQYPNFLIAQTTYSNVQMRNAMNQGFRDIAGFIFGNNVAQDKNQPEKIAMTAPVTVKRTQTEGYTISFVMPAKYTKETLPKPKNSRVQIKQIKSQKMASLSWRGNIPSPEQVQQKQKILREILKQHSYKSEETAYLFQYDPPFTPGWMRINQVLLKILDQQKSQQL